MARADGAFQNFGGNGGVGVGLTSEGWTAPAHTGGGCAASTGLPPAPCPLPRCSELKPCGPAVEAQCPQNQVSLPLSLPLSLPPSLPLSLPLSPSRSLSPSLPLSPCCPLSPPFSEEQQRMQRMLGGKREREREKDGRQEEKIKKEKRKRKKQSRKNERKTVCNQATKSRGLNLEMWAAVFPLIRVRQNPSAYGQPRNTH